MFFKIHKNPYGNNKPLYRYTNVEIKPGITILTGCNGSGKSTLLRLVEKELQYKNITYVKYNNLTDGGSASKSKALYLNNIELVASLMNSSEGESICVNIANFASEIGNLSKQCRESKQKEMFILFDAIDSGMSVDTIEEIKECLFNMIIEHDSKDLEVYIVVSANDYTMAKGEQCLDIHTGKYRTFGSYEDYCKYIRQSRKKKDKRYA